jgi:hypothetical protein
MLRSLDRWLVPYLLRRVPPADGRPLHLILAVCDHFEPLHASDKAGALRRLAVWREQFPKLASAFRDADGHPPKHTFFYPIEQYDPDLLDPLAELCRATGSEVEIHLHHEGDTTEGLRAALEQGKADLRRHGFLGADRDGAVRYGFIHGNWALNHSHPQGRGCGVAREIPILRGTGCYADFTLPSAPSPAQPRSVNRIAYLDDLPGGRALDEARPVRAGEGAARREDPSRLLMVQGPLALNWRRRKWGLLPRLENGDLTGANPPTAERLRLAADQRVSVKGRPDWVFVKWHTHGGVERNYETLLGEPMRRFHEALAAIPGLRLHYATAREMANLVHALEDGVEGEPGAHRDHWIRPPGA